MPHSLFIGSALATQDRIAYRKTMEDDDSSSTLSDSPTAARKSFLERLSPVYLLRACKSRVMTAFQTPPSSQYATQAKRHSERENNSAGFVSSHIYHGTIDVMLSLLGFAVVINSL